MALLRRLNHPAFYGALVLWGLFCWIGVSNRDDIPPVSDLLTVVFAYGLAFALFVRMAWSIVTWFLVFIGAMTVNTFDQSDKQ